MGLLDAYQDSTDTVLNVMAARPLEPDVPKPKHSAWSVLPRAVAAGVQEVAGNVLDTASAFGQVAAASGGLTPGFDPDAKKNRAQTLEAYDKLKTEGINWRSEEGQTYYDYARNLRPDPLTAGAAEQIIFGLGKGLTKAIGSAATLGTAGGAAAFGLSEGMTTAEDLAVQGVDQATRTKAGAVSGVINAAGIALPVAGRTLAETAGLVLVGGPGSFMAQQQLTRSILENANYGEIAKQFDPLDPVGLAISTLVPAGFAAYAKRGGFAKSETKPQETGTGAAKTETRADASPIAATQENIDAAMVHNITANQDARPAVERRQLLKAWDEVHQNPIGPADDPLVRLTPDDVSDVLVSRGPVSLAGDGVGIKVPGYGIVKFIWKHGPESGQPDAAKITRDDLAEFPFIMRQYEPEITATVSKKSGDTTEQMTWVVDREDGRRVIYGTTAFKADGEHHLVTVHVDSENRSMPSQKRKEPPTTSGQDTLQASRLDTAQESFSSSSREVDGGYTQSIGKDQETVTNAIQQRLDAMLADKPDMVTRIDDAGQPVRLADELAALKKRAEEGTDDEFGAIDAPLLQIAAECAITFGGV